MNWRSTVYRSRHADVLRRCCLSWPKLDTTVVEDAVGDVCVDMLRRRAYWDDVYARGGESAVVHLWRHAVKMKLTKRHKRPCPIFLPELETIAGSVSQTEGIVDARMTLARIGDVLPQVAEGVVRSRTRQLTEAVTLRMSHGLTNAEAGERVGVPREYVSRVVTGIKHRLAA